MFSGEVYSPTEQGNLQSNITDFSLIFDSLALNSLTGPHCQDSLLFVNRIHLGVKLQVNPQIHRWFHYDSSFAVINAGVAGP